MSIPMRYSDPNDPFEDGHIFSEREPMETPVLLKILSEKCDMEPQTVETFINAFIDLVADELAGYGKVSLVGFGTFGVVHRRVQGVDPETGENDSVVKNVPVFIPGKELAEAVMLSQKKDLSEFGICKPSHT